jgi:hypothetical protein
MNIPIIIFFLIRKTAVRIIKKHQYSCIGENTFIFFLIILLLSFQFAIPPSKDDTFLYPILVRDSAANMDRAPLAQ